MSVRGRVAPSRVTGTGRRRFRPGSGLMRSRAVGTSLAYLALTKPRVIELLLVTAIPAMLLAHRGTANPLLILNTLIGGMMAAGGANTLNCVADADIDKLMKRTERRPLARAAVPTRNALVLGLVLSVGSFFWLWWTTNLLSGLLAIATIAFYVFVYTLLLKRRTSQNVVWGGAAGCMPVMIGWSAVTGTIGWPALAMFAIIFFWTPPHTWALAMRYKDDYKAAGVPMLPAVATEREVTKQILIYTWLTVLATLVLALADRLAVRGGRGGGRGVVPGDGPPVVRRGPRRRAGQAAAAVPAIEQLPGGGVLRVGGRLGDRAADPALTRRAKSHPHTSALRMRAAAVCRLIATTFIALCGVLGPPQVLSRVQPGKSCCRFTLRLDRGLAIDLRQQHNRAGRLAALQVLVGAGGFGQRVTTADFDADGSARHRLE